MFEWLQTQPEKLASFGATMAAANTLKTRGVLTTLSRLFAFEDDHDQQVESNVLLVDIGGGRGKLLERFRQQRPDLKGRMVLQDLPKVIEGRETANGVEYLVHDFFTPQCIKGLSLHTLLTQSRVNASGRCTYIFFPTHFPRLAR